MVPQREVSLVPIRYQEIDMQNQPQECPYVVGDVVRFCPSERTRGHYQDVERFGLKVGEEAKIKSIEDGIYLKFDEGGGWPWTEFELVRKG